MISIALAFLTFSLNRPLVQAFNGLQHDLGKIKISGLFFDRHLFVCFFLRER